jgi:hypothetical protein
MTLATVSNWLGLPILSQKSRAYGQTKRDFYESRIYLQNLEKLTTIFNSVTPANIYTEKQITFYGIDFGNSIKDVINKLGRPNYKTSENRLFNDHRIIFYRLKISSVNCILQLHFINNSFFLGVVEMRTGNKELKESLFDLIKQKYKINESVVNSFVQDNSGSRIQVREDVIPYVVYTTGDPQLKNLLLSSAKQLIPVATNHQLQRQSLLLDMI